MYTCYDARTWTQVFKEAGKMWRDRFPLKPEGVQLRPVHRRAPNAILHPVARLDGYEEARPPSPFGARI